MQTKETFQNSAKHSQSTIIEKHNIIDWFINALEPINACCQVSSAGISKQNNSQQKYRSWPNEFNDRNKSPDGITRKRDRKLSFLKLKNWKEHTDSTGASCQLENEIRDDENKVQFDEN